MQLKMRCVLVLLLFAFSADSLFGQATQKWREIHKVKRKETIFGIARDYGITIDQLIEANPNMKTTGYELKKGDFLCIPWPETSATAKNEATPLPIEHTQHSSPIVSTGTDIREREIRVGVMLPLHDENGDGKRMIEYYRGVLMACDSLRQQGISVDVRAWNVPEWGDITKVLKEKEAEKVDLIIGPLYSKHVPALSEFVTRHDIRLLIPFSINAPELLTNRNIFQVYQSTTDQNESTVQHFLSRFKDYHTVVIDCNDSTSRKGIFTASLRRSIEQSGRSLSLTNLKSGDAAFANSFSTTKPNVVVLNTGRSPELNVAISKLNSLTMSNPNLRISLFGYTEWMMYTKYQLDNYYKYDTYIPGTFYLNPLSSQTTRIQQKYRWNFHSDMMQALPRFAITGFDQAFFMLKGLHLYGKNFTGAAGMVGYNAIQTPLHFERIGNGGLRNRSILFVHYTPGHRIETIRF